MRPHTTTTSRDAHCPTRAELCSFVDGALDEASEVSLSLHLDTCSKCRRTLEETAGEPSWWDEAQTFLAPRADHEAASWTPSASDAAHAREAHDAAEIAAEIRKWLGPTDDPQSLGRIGRYEVTGIIGAGSMGVVLKALEPQLKRFVAIKVLLPLLAHNGAARRRFSREARSAAAVSHPNVVPIYGVDEYQGLPYLVMQYVPGQSLAERIARDGPLAPEEVVRIALQTARALAAAHEQGLVHRDIKPANILLENGIERVLVTDFGLARIADDASMTRSGVITGTPQFMSPEQAAGRGVDAQSDLFSLGAAMYAMCTGHPPFRAATVFGLLKRICEDEPRPIRAVNPAMPDWLDAFIRKLLAKEPAERFESAAEAAAVLAEELAYLQNPSSVRPPARPWLARKIATTKWLSASAIGGIVVAATVSAVLLLRPPALEGEANNAPSDKGAAAAVDWLTADTSLSQLAADIVRFEAKSRPVPTAPQSDPWLAEFRALEQAITRLEQGQAKSAF